MWGWGLCPIQACVGNVIAGKLFESARCLCPSIIWKCNIFSFYCFPNHICWLCHSQGKLIFKENKELMVLTRCLIREVFVTPRGSYNKRPNKQSAENVSLSSFKHYFLAQSQHNSEQMYRGSALIWGLLGRLSVDRRAVRSAVKLNVAE